MTDGASYEARVTRVVRKYRRELIKRDHEAQKRFALQLREAHTALLKELADAQAAVESARARGVNENTFRLQRALEMAQQAENLLQQYAQNGTSYIAEQQRAVSQTAYLAAQEFLDTTSPPPPDFPNASSFMTFPQEALEVITAATSSGPVYDLLNRYGAEAAKEAGRALTAAIVLGTHSDVVGRQLSDALAVPLWKGAQIARTEINRAYQESLRETWRQNKAITPKWIWRSGRTASTCAVCWAMDGTEHDVDEPMGSHPSCRCSMVPKSVSWDDLAAQFGIEMPAGDFEPPQEQTGPEAFAELPPDVQRDILGPGKYRAYSAGEITLKDLVEERRSPDWGVSRGEGSLQRAKERSAARGGGSGGGGVPPGGGRADDEQPPTGQDLIDRRAAAPQTSWEAIEKRRLMPPDLREYVGADGEVLRADEHVRNVHLPPLPGAILNKSGDARHDEIGKHFSAAKYYESLEKWLWKWDYRGFSPPNKTPKGRTSWEVYSKVDGDFYLLTIISRNDSTGQFEIASSYLVGRNSVSNRIAQGYLEGRN